MQVGVNQEILSVCMEYGYCSMEFQYGNASTLEVLGTFDVTNGARDQMQAGINYKKLTMEHVCSARGPVMISGWLKEAFRSVVTASGASYGAGMICTDRYRMSVHISTFTPNSEIQEGMKISVRGTVERRGDAFILSTSSMDHISTIPEAPQMTENEMDEAVESPSVCGKTKASDGPEHEISKKLKQA